MGERLANVPNGTARRKRPIGVWVVSIWYAASALWTGLSFYLVLGGVLALNPAQKAYFQRLSAFDYLFVILLGLITLSAAVTLFLLRKQAVRLFFAALGLNGIMTIWHSIAKGAFSAIGRPGAAGAVLGLVVLFAVYLYSWKLARAGILT